MNDYSKDLFSYQGDVPTFLPSRIRLSDKTTRSPKQVTLEELNGAGYTGPYTVPDFNPSKEQLLWDSSSKQYTVIPSLHLISEDEVARGKINEIKNIYNLYLKQDTTIQFFSAVTGYIRELDSVSALQEPLKLSDIPVFKFSGFNINETVALTTSCYIKCFEEGEGVSPEFWFRKFSFLPSFPVSLVGYFSVPSGWTQDTEPNVTFVISPEADSLVSVSGFNTITGDSTYTFDNGQTVSLLQRAVYYP
jgi:hypothetical protein